MACVLDEFSLEEITNLVEGEGELAKLSHAELLAIEVWLIELEDVVYGLRYHVGKEIKRQ